MRNVLELIVMRPLLFTLKIILHLGKRLFTEYILPLIALAAVTLAMYGTFFYSPYVFDDLDFFLVDHPDYLETVFQFQLRWLPYATFEWTRYFLGDNIFWLRLGNVLLHIANGLMLFLLLRRLFELVTKTSPGTPENQALATQAFFGALLFLLHPAAVYGVAYLVQRTILMATLFSLATFLFFIEGLERNDRRLLWTSAATYLLACLSKEHAIMVPAVAFAMLMLLHRPNKQLLHRVWPTFLLYLGIGALIVYQREAGNIIATAYEPNGVNLLSLLHIDPREAYPLSILTQGFLYFKYLLLWVIPNTTWMSVDMRENFASSFLVWPETAGLTAFVLYPVIGVFLLLKRGRTGLLGFAILCPWLLFIVELSSVRIQETLVIYRSYLWMPCLAAALPFLLQKLTTRYSILILTTLLLTLLPPTWNRLTTFSDPLLLWDDALRLAQSKKAVTTGRIYHNRGVAYLDQNRFQEAIQDFDMGLKLMPAYSRLLHDRAVAYLEVGRYTDALNDFDSAIWLNPNFDKSYLGRALTYEKLDNQTATLKDYEMACMLGSKDACDKIKNPNETE